MQENMQNPLVSVIIVNYNWKKWLEKCISSLLNQTYKDFEIIFVDNASNDDSIEYMKNIFYDDRIKIIESKENSWFAWWNNLGIINSKWDYILLLNNDTWVKNDFLENFIKNFNESDLDILWVTEKMYDWSNNGNITNKIDFFWHPTYKKNSSNSEKVMDDLFFTCWVCILFRKDFYIKTWWLDNDFFMYVEEVDWMWRSRLYWGKIGQLSNLFIYHAWAGSSWDWIKYRVFLWRNQNTLQMLLKNYYWYNLLWVLPIYFLQNIAEIIAFAIFGKFKISYSYIEGWILNLQNLKKTLKKRKEIQEKRVISDKEIMKNMYKGFWKLNHLINYFKKHG